METAALTLLLSVAYTVLVGSVLLNLSTVGFSATWSHPVLEEGLLAITGAAAALAVLRGGFSRNVPPAPTPEPSGGAEGGWELMRKNEELARRERRLRHALRTAHDARESDRIRAELDGLGRERESLRNAREAEYAL